MRLAQVVVAAMTLGCATEAIGQVGVVEQHLRAVQANDGNAMVRDADQAVDIYIPAEAGPPPRAAAHKVGLVVLGTFYIPMSFGNLSKIVSFSCQGGASTLCTLHVCAKLTKLCRDIRVAYRVEKGKIVEVRGLDSLDGPPGFMMKNF